MAYVIVSLTVLGACAGGGVDVTTWPTSTAAPSTTAGTPAPALLVATVGDVVDVVLLDGSAASGVLASLPYDEPELPRITHWSGDRILATFHDALWAIDLTTGAPVAVAEAPPAGRSPATRIWGGFVPGGTAVIVSTDDGTVQELRVLAASGDTLLFAQARRREPVTWLVDEGGTRVLATHEGSLEWFAVADGAALGGSPLPRPTCRLLSWWDDEDVLVSCLTEYGSDLVEELWSGPTDGTDWALLAAPGEERQGCQECGYSMAYRVGDTVVAHWWSYDFVAEVHVIDDGVVSVLDLSGEPGDVEQVVAAAGGQIAVLVRPEAAITGFSSLGWATLDGGEMEVILRGGGAGVSQVLCPGGHPVPGW